MEVGIFLFDFTQIISFFSQSTGTILVELFAIGGYLFIVYALLFLGLMYYKEYREGLNTKDWKWVLLAVDVPPMNVQTPKAVEQMFAHIAGAFDQPDISAAFRGGFKQRWFSFEIISIEGYIQFLIRTESAFQDLVEAAIYAQYPEAEITEVEDYTNDIPTTYPNAEYDIWAADFGLAEDNAYPLRSYHEFEHSISKDTVLKDPMGAMLESFSRMGPGEQLWLQILLQPISNSWKEKAIKKIKEIIGEKVASGKGPNKAVDALLQAPMKVLEGVGNQVFGYGEGASASKSDDGPLNQLQFLTPGQKTLVEAMEKKISHVGFKTKIRGVYLARKEVFRPTRGVNSLIGSLNQFNSPTSNSLVPKFGSGASYFFKNKRISSRKQLLMQAYKKRKIGAGATPCILNIEELATIWHFPMSHVKTPLVQRVEAKQSEPPVGLPVERITPPLEGQLPSETSQDQAGTSSPDNYDTDAYGYRGDMKFG